jgi:miniconductance mechanosensitive channel
MTNKTNTSMDTLNNTQIMTEEGLDWLKLQLSEWGLTGSMLHYSYLIIALLIAVVGLLLLGYLLRTAMIMASKRLVSSSRSRLVGFMVQNKVFLHLTRQIILNIFVPLAPIIFADFPSMVAPVQKIVYLVVVFSWIYLLRAVFRSIRDYLGTKESFRDKPLDSYLQVINIIMVIIGFVVMFSIITNQSPQTFFTAMGAASAIIMLVFKDTILGFVASIQVSTNDMVRIGDWIEMPKYGADGDVVEINLNTVKIQNWDKTITTVPTYFLITDSFKNWRGMQEAGGRRIKRAILIKMSSIRYLNDKEIEELKKIQLIRPYIEQRQSEIANFNADHHIDKSMLVNGRNMTNVGLFRRYIMQYTSNNPHIRKDMTLLVRQLNPSEVGLPIELYMFTQDTRWAVYEEVMSDIFDHLLAAISYFHLEVFESPASDDLRSLTKAVQPILKESPPKPSEL